jgi:hypothetical protein
VHRTRHINGNRINRNNNDCATDWRSFNAGQQPMRQTLSKKNVNKIARQTGLPVLAVLVRGGTDHRKDLCLDDGSVMHLEKDGTMEISPIKWNIKRYYEETNP